MTVNTVPPLPAPHPYTMYQTIQPPQLSCKPSPAVMRFHQSNNILPGSIYYRTRLCTFHVRNGFCARGNECSFAHSAEELRTVPPGLRKKRMCEDWLMGRCPSQGVACPFAHGEADMQHLKYPTDTSLDSLLKSTSLTAHNPNGTSVESFLLKKRSQTLVRLHPGVQSEELQDMLKERFGMDCDIERCKALRLTDALHHGNGVEMRNEALSGGTWIYRPKVDPSNVGTTILETNGHRGHILPSTPHLPPGLCCVKPSSIKQYSKNLLNKSTADPYFQHPTNFTSLDSANTIHNDLPEILDSQITMDEDFGSEFACSICRRSVPYRPIVSICLHIFCGPCIVDWSFTNESSTFSRSYSSETRQSLDTSSLYFHKSISCPICMKTLKFGRDMRQLNQYSIGLDKSVHRVILYVKIECVVEGCSWQGPISKYGHHLSGTCGAKAAAMGVWPKPEHNSVYAPAECYLVTGELPPHHEVGFEVGVENRRIQRSVSDQSNERSFSNLCVQHGATGKKQKVDELTADELVLVEGDVDVLQNNSLQPASEETSTALANYDQSIYYTHERQTNSKQNMHEVNDDGNLYLEKLKFVIPTAVDILNHNMSNSSHDSPPRSDSFKNKTSNQFVTYNEILASNSFNENPKASSIRKKQFHIGEKTPNDIAMQVDDENPIVATLPVNNITTAESTTNEVACISGSPPAQQCLCINSTTNFKTTPKLPVEVNYEEKKLLENSESERSNLDSLITQSSNASSSPSTTSKALLGVEVYEAAVAGNVKPFSGVIFSTYQLLCCNAYDAISHGQASSTTTDDLHSLYISTLVQSTMSWKKKSQNELNVEPGDILEIVESGDIGIDTAAYWVYTVLICKPDRRKADDSPTVCTSSTGPDTGSCTSNTGPDTGGCTSSTGQGTGGCTSSTGPDIGGCTSSTGQGTVGWVPKFLIENAMAVNRYSEMAGFNQFPLNNSTA